MPRLGLILRYGDEGSGNAFRLMLHRGLAKPEVEGLDAAIKPVSVVAAS